MKLKSSLLYMILQNSPTPHRYTSAYNSLKNVIELELKDDFEVPQEIIEKFKVIKINYNNFINNIPLVVIEKFFNNFRDDLRRYIFIEYQNNELNLKAIDIYLLLEDFFNDIYALACEIASYYNLEIKLNDMTTKSKKEYL